MTFICLSSFKRDFIILLLSEIKKKIKRMCALLKISRIFDHSAWNSNLPVGLFTMGKVLWSPPTKAAPKGSLAATQDLVFVMPEQIPTSGTLVVFVFTKWLAPWNGSPCAVWKTATGSATLGFLMNFCLIHWLLWGK